LVTNKPKHILIAPLDWGLGHTTRCVPLIRHIQGLGHVPVVACNASQRLFIEETFGPIDIIHLEGYNISYSQWNKWAQIGLLAQLPHIQRTIRNEHNWLQQLTMRRQIDGIISDNRYGLWHPRIPSVIVTHQLMVRTGLGKFADHTIQKLHYKYLNRFNEVWVPDESTAPGLAGELSHPSFKPCNTKYIGLLSRFHETDLFIGRSFSEGGRLTTHSFIGRSFSEGGRLLILLSGPEPQRTDLSQLLWQQVQHYDGKVIFVEGSEHAITPTNIPQHITYHKRLTDTALAPLMQQASMIICRSGYSTLMDLAAIQKKAILIPTPGQTEQEYLATSLHAAGIFYIAPQKGFQLATSLREASHFPFEPITFQQSFTQHKKVLEDWIQSLS
jgi:hypothetical protein